MKKEREEGEGERVQYLPLKQLTEVNLQDFKTALELYSSVKAIYHTRVLYVFSLNLWFVFLFFFDTVEISRRRARRLRGMSVQDGS
jgi:hypothetical protein